MKPADLAIDSKIRSVIVYPITIDDLTDSKFKVFLEKAISFHVVFQHEWQFKDKVQDG